MYKYDTILAALQKNSSVRIDSHPLPACPLKSTLCKKPGAACQKGDSGNCEQSLKIWYDSKKLRILYPRFVHPSGSTSGYFFEYDRGIAFLVEKGILTHNDLEQF